MRSVIHYEFVKIVWIVRLPIWVIRIHPLTLIVLFLQHLAGPLMDGGVAVGLAVLGDSWAFVLKIVVLPGNISDLIHR